MSEYYCKKCNHKLRCYDPGMTSYWICDECGALYVLKTYENKTYDYDRKKYIKTKREIMEEDLKEKNNG